MAKRKQKETKTYLTVLSSTDDEKQGKLININYNTAGKLSADRK